MLHVVLVALLVLSEVTIAHAHMCKVIETIDYDVIEDHGTYQLRLYDNVTMVRVSERLLGCFWQLTRSRLLKRLNAYAAGINEDGVRVPFMLPYITIVKHRRTMLMTVSISKTYKLPLPKPLKAEHMEILHVPRQLFYVRPYLQYSTHAKMRAEDSHLRRDIGNPKLYTHAFYATATFASLMKTDGHIYNEALLRKVVPAYGIRRG